MLHRLSFHRALCLFAQARVREGQQLLLRAPNFLVVMQLNFYFVILSVLQISTRPSILAMSAQQSCPFGSAADVVGGHHSSGLQQLRMFICLSSFINDLFMHEFVHAVIEPSVRPSIHSSIHSYIHSFIH